MKQSSLLGNLLIDTLKYFTGNVITAPTITSITTTKEANSQENIIGVWSNINSTYVLIPITIIGALILNNRCYGREKRVWIDDCILNQIVFLVVLSLLFNLESRVIPSNVSVSGTSGGSFAEADIFEQTPVTAAPAIAEGVAIATSEPFVVEALNPQ